MFISCSVSGIRLCMTHLWGVRIEGCPEGTPVNFTTMLESELKDI